MRSSSLSDMVPVGADACVGGGKNIGFQIDLPQFYGPVDVYLGIFAPALSGEVFLLTESGVARLLSQGLAPWKKALSGPLSEKLFADVPVSLLPDGTYYMLLLVTPADTFDTSYFWIASFVVPGVCAPRDVPVGSAGYVNGKVIAPGAKILHDGTLHEGEFPVSDNALLAITKGQNVYLYHPALGNAELSDETSRRAVGHYLAGLAVNIGSQGLASPQKFLVPGSTISLDTGIDVHRNEEGAVEVINKSKRWAAVKTDAGVTAYLTPRDDFIEVNMLNLIKRIYNTDVFGFDSKTVKVNSKIETYGAVSRGLSSRYDDPDVKEAQAHDSRLFSRLNTLDYGYFALEGAKQIAGLYIEECTESLFSSFVIGQIEVAFVTILTSDEAGKDSAAWKTFEDQMKALMQDIAKCAATAGSVAGGPVGLLTAEGIAQVFDIISALQWSIDDLIGVTISTTFILDAYDEVVFELEEKVSLHCTATGDLVTNEQGEVILTCSLRSNSSTPPKLVSVVADLSELGGPGSFQLGPKQTYMSGTVSVTPPGSGDLQVYFRGTDERMREMTAVAGIHVKSPELSITGCTASGSLSVNKPGSIAVSCTTTGDAASVSADLTQVGGSVSFALTDKGGGTWEGATTVNPPKPGEQSILFSAAGAQGNTVQWSASVTVGSAQCPISEPGWKRWLMKWYDDTTCTKQWGDDLWHFNADHTVTEHFSGRLIEGYTWSIDGSTFTIVAGPDKFGYKNTYTGTIDAQCQHMRGEALCESPGGCAVPRSCWTAELF